MTTRTSRRQFLASTSAASAVLWGGCQTSTSGRRVLGANDRLNIACVGTSGRAASNIAGVKGENIVALCDVDETLLAAAGQRFPGARLYADFRRLMEQRDIDAVVVSTPDHSHAVCAMAALKSGRHVYCEKPLTRTVSEARALRDIAKYKRLATQMGNQIHAGQNYRRVVEAVSSGVIGLPTEVHVWAASTYGHIPYPTSFPALPPKLNWDLWLGPVESVPYHPDFIPAKWRNWWAFGGGTLADFGCHYMDLPHWALDLHAPATIEAITDAPADPQRAPVKMIVKYAHAETQHRPQVMLTWCQGGIVPEQLPEKFRKDFRAGVLFVGPKGMLLANYTKFHLLPEEKFEGWQAPPQTIPNSIGHHAEWILACKTGSDTMSPFSYGGELTEAVLLGNVAHRAGCKLVWDAVNARTVNCPEAAEYIQHRYRKGWRL